MPGRRRCGDVDDGPSRLELTSSWPPHSAAASPDNEPGWGHYGNGPETLLPAAAAAHECPGPCPEDGPDPGGQTKTNIIIISD